MALTRAFAFAAALSLPLAAAGRRDDVAHLRDRKTLAADIEELHATDKAKQEDAVNMTVGKEWSLLEGTPVKDFICCCTGTAEAPNCVYMTRCTGTSVAAKTKDDTTKSKIWSQSCRTTGTESFDPESRSLERMQCTVADTMSEKIFPPEIFAGHAIRLALPAIPVAGDTYVAIQSVEIVQGSLFITFERKDDRTFSFRIHGADEGQASFQVYIRGFKFICNSGLEKHAQNLQTTEVVLSNVFTLGLVNTWKDKDYGSLDNVPLKIKTTLSGDFRLNDKGKWEIDEKSRTQHADVILESGGVIMAIVNKIIKDKGGMDAIFFNLVWPTVEKLVPPSLGLGFQEVSHEDGHVKNQFELTLSCSSGIVAGNTCPGNRLSVAIKTRTSVVMNPQPIIRKLYDENYFLPGLRDLITNVLEAYKTQAVFDGAHVEIAAVAEIKEDKELVLSASPRMTTKMGFLSSLVGPGLNLQNFVPRDGLPLSVEGALSVDNGAVRLKDFKLQDVTLPAGQSGFMSFGCQADLELTLEDDGGNPNFQNNMIFGRTPQLYVDLNELFMSLGEQSGFIFNPLRTSYTTGEKVSVRDFNTWIEGTVAEDKGDGTYRVNLPGKVAVTVSAGQLHPEKGDYVGTFTPKDTAGSPVEVSITGGKLTINGVDMGQVAKAIQTVAGPSGPVDAVIIEAGNTLSQNQVRLVGAVDELRNIKGTYTWNSQKGTFRLFEKPTLVVKLIPKFLQDILVAAGMGVLADPPSIRSEVDSNKADGVVPLKFKKPFSTAPSGLDINQILRDADLNIGITMEDTKAGEGEHIEFGVVIEGRIDLNVAPSVYATFLNNIKPDFGYMHYTIPGLMRYGSENIQSVATLSCGTLRFFKESVAATAQSAPFKEDPVNLKSGGQRQTEFDLKNSLPSGLFRVAPDTKPGWSCVAIGEYETGIFSGGNKAARFCSETIKITELVEAVNLQVARFADASTRWKAACDPGVDGGHPTCSHSPDGTWFEHNNPLKPNTWFPGRRLVGDGEVKTPFQEWKDAFRMAFTYT